MTTSEIAGWMMLAIGGTVAMRHLWVWWQDRQWRRRHDR